MKSPDKSILEKAIRKLRSIMSEQSIKKLTIQRQYLPEIFDADLLEVYEGLPILKPLVENYFRSKGITVKISSKEIKFKEPTAENLDDILKKFVCCDPRSKSRDNCFCRRLTNCFTTS